MQKTDIYTRYENGKQWKREEGQYKDFPMYERFYAGNQWPKATANTKDLPRPVLNIIYRIGSFKVSSVMRQPLKAMFSPQEISSITEDANEQELLKIAEILGLYMDTLYDRLDEEKTDEMALTKAMNVGACFAHTYWDNEIVRGNGKEATGELQREIIDSLNVYFDNPQEEDPQKQQRIRLVQPKLVAEVKQMAKELGLKQEEIDKIAPDERENSNEQYDKQENENDNGLKVDLITEYEVKRVKVDGKWTTKVFWSKATKTVILQEDVELKGHKLIPISSMVWQRRNSSAYGTSEIGHLIPNQKAINFLVAMMLLSAQNTGWPALVVDDKAVKTNPRNKPGEVHRIDTSKTGGNVANAMRYLDTGNFSAQIFTVLDRLIEYTKDFSGANESALGEAKDLSGQAINRLQTASAIPLQTNKRNFRDYKKQNAKIDAEFFLNNYTERSLTYKNKDGQIDTFMFDPEKVANTRFDIGIDIGSDTEYSAELSEASLKNLLDTAKIDLVQYLKYADPKVVPFAKQMLEDMQNLEMEGDNIAEIVMQIREMDPQQREQFLAQDMETIMATVSQVLSTEQ